MNAGVAVINAINKRGGTPVLVVSGMPASIYRSIMKALDAWDYLQKSDFVEQEFVETFLDMLRAVKAKGTAPEATSARAELSLDPLRQKTFHILRASNYRGYCSMEWEGGGDPYAGTQKLIAASLQYLT